MYQVFPCDNIIMYPRAMLWRHRVLVTRAALCLVNWGLNLYKFVNFINMIKTSGHGKAFRITSPLYWETTCGGPFTQRANYAELSSFLCCWFNELLNKQSKLRWFGMLWRWHSCDVTVMILVHSIPDFANVFAGVLEWQPYLVGVSTAKLW